MENVSSDEGAFESDKQNEEEILDTKQKLKAAIHYFLGKIAEKELGETRLEGIENISKQTVAVLTEFIYDYAENLGSDLESFAKHAKRTTVSQEDVKLCARKNEALQQSVNGYANKLVEVSGQKKAATSKKRKKVEEGDKPKKTKSKKKQTEETVD